MPARTRSYFAKKGHRVEDDLEEDSPAHRDQSQTQQATTLSSLTRPTSTLPQQAQLPSRLPSQTPLPSTQPLTSAMSKVFETTELLEAILLNLPVDRLLLLSQRTCRAFHATIHGSLQIQRRLFFRLSESVFTPAFNPMFAGFAIAKIERQRVTLMDRLPLALQTDRLKAVFKHNDELWVLSNVRPTWIKNGWQRPRSFLRRRRREPDETKVLGWSIVRIAKNEVLSCPVFDLACSSIRSMYLTQPATTVTVVLWSCNPDATVMTQDGCRERHTVVDSICSPSWVAFGHAYAKFDVQGKTIGEIFAEAASIDGRYEVRKGAPGVAEEVFLGCDCEKCERQRTPEQKAARLRAIEIWEERNRPKPCKRRPSSPRSPR